MANPLYWQTPHVASIVAHVIQFVTGFALFVIFLMFVIINSHDHFLDPTYPAQTPVLAWGAGAVAIFATPFYVVLFAALTKLESKERSVIVEQRYFQKKMAVAVGCLGSLFVIFADVALAGGFLSFVRASGSIWELKCYNMIGFTVTGLAAISASSTIPTELYMLRMSARHARLLEEMDLEGQEELDTGLVAYHDEE